MPINRAAIVQQLQWQLQQHFNDGADIHLLKQPDVSTDIPQLVIALSHELDNIKPQKPLNFARQLMVNLHCQINQTNELLMLQSFDTLATGIDQVLSSHSQHNLWLAAKVVRTDFDFAPLTSPDKALMNLSIELCYQVIEDENCPDLTINQVYLSNQGDPYELVTTLPDNQ